MRNIRIHVGLSRVAIFAIVVLASCAPAGGERGKSLVASYKFADKNGLVILSARIGDSAPLLFLLDTGASPCVLDSATAARRGITAGVATQRRGGAGTFASGRALQPVRLTIGADILACSETIVTDLSGLTEVTGAKLAGIIGGDFFRGRVVALDYDRDVAAVYDRNAYRYRMSGKRVPIRIEKNRPFLTAALSVPGGPQNRLRELMIDTGSLDHIDDASLKEGTNALKATAAQGLGTGFTAQGGTFSRVVIGSHEFSDVPGYVPSVAIVGTGILARFNPIFDYDGGWMILAGRRTKP